MRITFSSLLLPRTYTLSYTLTARKATRLTVVRSLASVGSAPSGKKKPSKASDFSEDELEILVERDEEGKVILPEKPVAPTTCCGSGCAYCVWDVYRDQVERYRAARQVLRKSSANEQARKGEGKEEEEREEEDELESAESPMDEGMRAFLEMEKRMKG